MLGTTDLWRLRAQLVGDASAALFVLFATTTLSVYKPWCMTPYGLRRQREEMPGRRPPLLTARTSRAIRAGGALCLIVLLLLIHLAGGGFHGH